MLPPSVVRIIVPASPAAQPVRLSTKHKYRSVTSTGDCSFFHGRVCADDVFDIFIFDSLNAITLSGDPEGLYPIAKITTTNSGETWNNEELPFFGLSFAIDFRTYNEGWSASGYKFLLTNNRGVTWEEFETPDSVVVYDLQFIDARTGYAVGEQGVILKLDPTLVGVENEPGFLEDFILSQNYPNPFNPNTVISYRLPVSSNVSLKVYDVLGNEVVTLVDEYKSAGAYEIEFNTMSNSGESRELVSGIYFYQLRIRGSEINSEQTYIQTKKMILLK